jgi:hypothetical protein
MIARQGESRGAGAGAGRPHPPLLTSAILCIAASTPAAALDTIECFDLGATDVEIYAGAAELGRGGGQVAQEFVLGLGLTETLSAYAGVPVSADQHLASAAAELHFGIFGTLLTRDHWSLDLLFDACVAGDGWSELILAPGLEINYDRIDPAGANGWGLFLQGQVAAHPELHTGHGGAGGATGVGGAGSAGDALLALHSDLALGIRYRISDTHEWLLQVDGAVPLRSNLEDEATLGALTCGYNFQLAATIELITEWSLQLPQGGEKATFGFLLGFIASLPSA